MAEYATGGGGTKKQLLPGAGGEARGLAAAALGVGGAVGVYDEDEDDVFYRQQPQRGGSPEPERSRPQRYYGSSGRADSDESPSPRGGGGGSRRLLGPGAYPTPLPASLSPRSSQAALAAAAAGAVPPAIRSPSERAASPSSITEPPPLLPSHHHHHGGGGGGASSNGPPTSPGPRSCFRLDESGASLLTSTHGALGLVRTGGGGGGFGGAGGGMGGGPFLPGSSLGASGSFGESSGGGGAYGGPTFPPSAPLSPRAAAGAHGHGQQGRRSPVAGLASPVRAVQVQSQPPQQGEQPSFSSREMQRGVQFQSRGQPRPAKEYEWFEEEADVMGEEMDMEVVEEADGQRQSAVGLWEAAVAAQGGRADMAPSSAALSGTRGRGRAMSEAGRQEERWEVEGQGLAAAEIGKVGWWVVDAFVDLGFLVGVFVGVWVRLIGAPVVTHTTSHTHSDGSARRRSRGPTARSPPTTTPRRQRPQQQPPHLSLPLPPPLHAGSARSSSSSSRPGVGMGGRRRWRAALAAVESVGAAGRQPRVHGP